LFWTAKRVEAWLVAAVDVLQRLPDLEARYLRNPLRSRFPEVVETWSTAFVAALGAIEVDGVPPGSEMKPTSPSPQEIDEMEAAIFGLSKPRLGLSGTTPWLNWLGRKRRRMVWRRLAGGRDGDRMTWTGVAALEDRSGQARPSEATCRRWYWQAMQCIADELTTENG